MARNLKRAGKGHGGEQGSALLLVLFTILLLSSLIVAAVELVKNDIDEYRALNRMFRARQLAESGLAFGLEPLVQNRDRSLLEQQMEDGGKFRVQIASESSKLNPNLLLQGGRDNILEKLFDNWGAEAKASKEAVQSLRKFLSGPPNLQGPDRPVQLTKQFQSVQELSLIPEFVRITENQPDWENYFTVWGDGKIDVNLADAAMIELITGVTSAQADQFVKHRWGPDKKPDTDDDLQYQSMDQVRAALGLSTGQFELVQDLLSLNSAVDRVDSTGTIAGYSKTVTVITNRGAAQPRILSWQEK